MSDPTPMACDEALRLLAVYLDGELAGGREEALELHLQRCRGCFSRAEFERRLKAEVGRLGREDASPGFEERIRGLLGSFSSLPAAEPAEGG